MYTCPNEIVYIQVLNLYLMVLGWFTARERGLRIFLGNIARVC